MEKIGKYEVLEPLGKGAMGLVYKAQDPEIGRIVAIKTLKSMYMGEDAVGAEAMQRFRQESRSAGRLQHPNIVTIFEAGRGDDGSPFIVMSYIDGKSLDKILSERGPVDPLEVVHYLAQISSAVDYAHRQNVVHRDIKPSNVLVDGNATPHLLDFGVAKLGDTSLTPAGTVVGTPSYMSPEQIRGEQLDGRADIFSLSVVAYELLTKQRPFPGGDFTSVVTKIIHEPPILITTIAPGFPKALDEVFSRGLAKDRADRFGTATEFAQALARQFGVSIDGFGIIGGFDRSRKWDPKSANQGSAILSPSIDSNTSNDSDLRVDSPRSVEQKGKRFATGMFGGLALLIAIVALAAAIIPLSEQSDDFGRNQVASSEDRDRQTAGENARDEEVVEPQPEPLPSNTTNIDTQQVPVTEADVPIAVEATSDSAMLPGESNLRPEVVAPPATYSLPEEVTPELIASLSSDQLSQAIDNLEEPSTISTKTALMLVANIGMRAEVALAPYFSKFLSHEDYAVRVAVLKQMRRSPYSDTPQALEFASKLLDDPEYLVRGFAAKALMDIPSNQVVPLLEDRLSRESHPVVQQVLRDGLIRLEQSVKSR